jgi:galactonate dehydratase
VEPLTVKDSFVELPTTPGHGIDIDVTRLKARPYHDRSGKGLRQYWEEFPRKNYVAGVIHTGH